VPIPEVARHHSGSPALFETLKQITCGRPVDHNWKVDGDVVVGRAFLDQKDL